MRQSGIQLRAFAALGAVLFVLSLAGGGRAADEGNSRVLVRRYENYKYGPSRFSCDVVYSERPVYFDGQMPLRVHCEIAKTGNGVTVTQTVGDFVNTYFYESSQARMHAIPTRVETTTRSAPTRLVARGRFLKVDTLTPTKPGLEPLPVYVFEEIHYRSGRQVYKGIAIVALDGMKVMEPEHEGAAIGQPYVVWPVDSFLQQKVGDVG